MLPHLCINFFQGLSFVSFLFLLLLLLLFLFLLLQSLSPQSGENERGRERDKESFPLRFRTIRREEEGEIFYLFCPLFPESFLARIQCGLAEKKKICFSGFELPARSCTRAFLDRRARRWGHEIFGYLPDWTEEETWAKWIGKSTPIL